MDRNNEKRNENLSFITDEDALTEIDFGSFLDETSKDAPVFQGFHEDIERTEKSLENELQSLYDDIMSSGPATIVPKPLSMITEPEEEKAVNPAEKGLEELWMNPEEYFEIDIPVVSLDKAEEEDEEDIPEEAFFKPEPQAEAKEEESNSISSIEAAKDDIFGLINSMKSDSESETGFSSLLAEIEANTEIAPVENDYNSIAGFLNTLPVTEKEPEITDIPEVPEIPQKPEIQAIEAPAEEPEAEVADIILPAEEKATETDDAVIEYKNEESEDNYIFDTDSEEFERELAALLGDTPEEPAPEPADAPEGGFVVNIPDDGNDYSFAAAQSDIPAKAPENNIFFNPADTSGFEPVAPEAPERVIGDFKAAEKFALEASAEESKEEKKARKKREKEEKKNGEKKPLETGEIIRRIVLTVSIIVIIVSAGIIANTYLIQPQIAKGVITDTVGILEDGMKEHGQQVVDSGIRQQYDVSFPEGMLAKYAPLYASNTDLRGWISIPAFEINLPVVQGTDNDYYLKRNIYKKWTDYGVPFFDFRIAQEQFETLPRNTVIYGHNMRSDDLIFGMLEEYREPDGFKKAPIIECNTIYGDYTWVVCSVFISNGEPEQDNGYRFPYNFIDCSDQKFADYIVELEKRTLYDTGVDLAVTDKILTLSTCCYDFEDARLVVVARLLREGESVSIDTSKVVKNPDPKGPEAWCKAEGKPNNYADDARW